MAVILRIFNGLGEHVGSASNGGAGGVSDDEKPGVEVSPAVRPVYVECEGGALDVEPVEHEDRSHNPGQSLKNKII